MGRLSTLLPFLLLSGMLSAQHENSSPDHEFRHLRAAVLIGHTLIPDSPEGPDPSRLFIPSWGVDLEYWVKPTWGIGLHSDLEIETFIVELENGADQLERVYPVVLTLDALVKPWKDLVLQVGPGVELEKNENFSLVRFGVEYEFEFGSHWDISPTFFYDTRSKAFDTWTFALAVGKRF